MDTVTIKTITLEEVMMNKEALRFQGIMILDHGWHHLIQSCTEEGISVVMPNFLVSPHLILQTIVQLNRTLIVTSQEIWSKIREAFECNPSLLEKMSVMLF
ncbi:MAG: hypothetical protein HKN76_06175 [Saprospiraceae bacterium]|nr:hypothetical protein [Saprospiraceae bacterium]